MKKIATIAGAGVAALALGASVVSPAIAAPLHSAGHSQHGRGDRVTGPEAQQAIDAAIAAVPGTADHAHKTADGGYRVMVRTSDGTTVMVTLDAAFAVTGQQEVTGRGKGRVTDDERSKASDAAVAAVPGATVLKVHKSRDGGFDVLVRTSDGVRKLVVLDADYGVVSVQDAKAHKHRGHHKGADVTGEAAAKAEAAALGAVPGGTVRDVHKKGAGYHVLVEKADGSKVLVTLDADFGVKDTKSFRVRTAA